ncbi:acyl-CoA thioesterase [Psychrosphaera aestuarii]|uniref:acyl-CoA thioesterase n=1 Tax=Psychrosphaera aestuarii TaxID=1266052 RepID=UPI001B33294F|nr:acyl-CoA thioesterase [Psychrosphaera aestuarii]
MHKPSRSVEFRFLAEPTDVNFGGKVHGGIVMKWIDQAAYACAAGWSGKYCITVSVGAIRFVRPVLVGNLVTVEATVVHTGNSSMHIYVSVKATDPKLSNPLETNHCIITFIAVDADGDKVLVEPWKPKTKLDKKLQQYAINMKDLSIQAENKLRES